MSEETVVNPPGVQKQLQFMLREQELLNNKRLELLNQLRLVWKGSVGKLGQVLCNLIVIQ